MVKICPLCNELKNDVLFKNMFDDRYGFPSTYSVLFCKKCQHSFLDAKFSDIEISQLYSRFYPRSNFTIQDFQPFKETSTFLSWLEGIKRSAYKWVPPNKKVLDIGCGFCQTLDYHTKRGCEVWGVEADENVRSLAAIKGFRLKTGLFSSDDYEASSFDYVTLDQVLEHIVDPIPQLRGIARILKLDGYIILSIPNAKGWGKFFFGRKWINWHIPYHVQHFSRNSIRKALNESGFKLVKLETITSSDWLYYQVLHMLTFPERSQKSIFWTHNLKVANFVQKVGFKILSYLYRLKLFHLMTRFFDAIGIGDNILVIARKII